MLKRAAALIVLLLLAASPAAAADARANVVDALGAISIAPQLCGVSLDRVQFETLEREVAPADAAFAVDVFHANDRYAAAAAHWSAADRQRFCDATLAKGRVLGLLT